MTLPRLKALIVYRREHPPFHLMVATYLGVTPRPETSADPGELMA